MEISIIGTGYVGLVQGACFAETGNTVVCMDNDEKKIANLKKGIIPIYEPGLEEMVQRNAQEKRLEFTTSLKTASERGEVIFLCLPTPQSEDGSADLTRVLAVAEQIASVHKRIQNSCYQEHRSCRDGGSNTADHAKKRKTRY